MVDNVVLDNVEQRITKLERAVIAPSQSFPDVSPSPPLFRMTQLLAKVAPPPPREDPNLDIAQAIMKQKADLIRLRKNFPELEDFLHELEDFFPAKKSVVTADEIASLLLGSEAKMLILATKVQELEGTCGLLQQVSELAPFLEDTQATSALKLRPDVQRVQKIHWQQAEQCAALDARVEALLYANARAIETFSALVAQISSTVGLLSNKQEQPT